MFRPTSFLALAGLVIMGIVIADVLKNPTGTQAAATGLVSVLKPSYDALLGQAP